MKETGSEAKEKATQNSAEFLNDLATRLKSLEDQRQVAPEQIAHAQEQPDFFCCFAESIIKCCAN